MMQGEPHLGEIRDRRKIQTPKRMEQEWEHFLGSSQEITETGSATPTSS